MKKGLKVLLIADTFSTLALGLLGPIYAIFVEQIGGDILDASWAYFTYMFTTGFVMLVLGRWEDAHAHKEAFIITGYMITAVGCLSYIFVFNQVSLIGTQVLFGFASALYVPAFDALYSEFLDAKKRATQWSMEEAMICIATAISALLGGYIVDVFGFTVLFLCMFGISLLSVFVSLYLLHNKKYLRSH